MEEESVDSDKFVEKSASTTKKRFIPEVQIGDANVDWD